MFEPLAEGGLRGHGSEVGGFEFGGRAISRVVEGDLRQQVGARMGFAETDSPFLTPDGIRRPHRSSLVPRGRKGRGDMEPREGRGGSRSFHQEDGRPRHPHPAARGRTFEQFDLGFGQGEPGSERGIVILLAPTYQKPEGPSGPSRHTPVLLQEVLDALRPDEGGFFVDATVGGGGHAEAILHASEFTRLLAIDRDWEALQRSEERLAPFGDRVQFVHAPFSALESVIPTEWIGNIAGILADFGLSSDQIEDRERGFSFQVDGPLDMRMDATRQKLSAAKLLAESSEDQLEKWLREFGEERFSRRIAHAIVYQRRFGNLLRTSQLADLVERTIPRGRQGIHPATRTFQGIRIAVNRELDEISALLEAAPRILGAAGTLACMSFHSLEDRIVKRSFRNDCRSKDFQDVLPKGVTAKPAEIRRNPRSRSARLRAIRRSAS